MISIIIAGSIVLLLSTFYWAEGPDEKSPEAVHGYLDLSGWNFSRGKTALLNGEWFFYPGQLFNPEELPAENAYFIKVPGGWEKQNKEYTQPARGNGTYRLLLKLPELQEPFAIKIKNIWMAHRLFINGKLVKEAGLPSVSPEGYRPENTPYLVGLEAGGEVELVIQVSNHVFYDGGISHPIQIGSKQSMERRDKLSFAADMVEFIIFLLFGIYHVNMYQMRDKEATYLYSGIFLIARSVTVATMGEKLLMQLVGGLPFEAAYKILDFSLFFSLTALGLFIQALEPGVMKRRTLNIFLLPVLIFLGLILFTPYRFYMYFKIPVTFYADILLFFYTLHFVYTVFFKKRRNMPANEAVYIALCITFTVITIIDSLLYYTGYINNSLISKLSMLGFLLCMNLFQARRFTNKMNEVQSLSLELIKADEIKDEFMARTSHELKAPLQGIIHISSHLLKEERFSLTAEQKENLSLIQDISAKLFFLVNDLIDVTKLRHEDLQLKAITLDLHVVIQVIFQLLSFDLQGKTVKLVNLVSPGTFVEADENRLKQILYNISSNAVKYTESGEVTARTEGDDKTITLTISDTGCGIPKEQWEQIFTEFNHDILSERQYKQGLGLGLYISRQLARKMKGDVWIANSVPGEGTSLSLRLPRGRLQNSSAAVLVPLPGKKPYQPRRESPAPNKNSKKILLVDDEPANIRVLSIMLEGEYQVSAAYNGEEALQLLHNRKFHLVITDMMMPGMSGIELTQRIRQSYSPIELPIIIATVRNGDREIELAYQNGANDYITKPFTEEELQWRVRGLLKLTDTMERAFENEVAFLQAQIKPHFIYNALSNIIALCYEDGERAAELLSMLSRYLRYIFQRDRNQQTLSLNQELDIIKTYVEIEKLRFGGRLHYETYIDPAVLDSKIKIPALLIQPLIENAIRHGLFNKQGKGTVSLCITEGEGFIRIVVEDDGVGMSDDEVYRLLHEKGGKGIGIKNTQMRMASFPKAAFLIDLELEKGTRCVLFLPKELT
jgi:two-component system sensor histidine kinase ChiS